MKDLGIVALSVAVAVVLARTGAFEHALNATKGSAIFGSFIGGLFFTSIFTAAPAVVVLGEIANQNSILLVALIGAAGSVIGDLFILRFIEDTVTEDFKELVRRAGGKNRIASIFKLRLFRWLMAFLGALVIASPLPDELGLFMMGLSKVKNSYFIPLSFALNFAGIAAVGIIARQLL
ncbi:hypothetical protein C4587_00380 [Candidatus Parcubacteria bacterium]|nr:MAG: hypothetical protein C4587_00380 [Candidatus Parcubacteria bacterium]